MAPPCNRLSLSFFLPLSLPLRVIFVSSPFSRLSQSIQRTRWLNYKHLVHLLSYLSVKCRLNYERKGCERPVGEIGRLNFKFCFQDTFSLGKTIESFLCRSFEIQKLGQRSSGRNAQPNGGSGRERFRQEVAHEMNPVYFRSCHYPINGRWCTTRFCRH